MSYVEVLISGANYHGKGPLTYRSDKILPVGKIVQIPLKEAQALGVVTNRVQKPSFPVRNIIGYCDDLPLLPLPLHQLLLWMKSYYPSPWGLLTQQFLPHSLPKKHLETVTPEKPLANNLPPLTNEQKSVLNTIGNVGTHLLHGDTGTGKTRVYIELAKRCIEDGKSAIVLTPEIGLTSQLADDFRQVFDNRVVVIHSQLTKAVRQRLWLLLLKQPEPMIVVGPRSALFSPLARLGLIIIDEAHEPSYKQEQAPYYHASRVGVKLAQLHHAIGVLGSATPLVNDYFLAEARHRPILRMTQLAVQSESTEKKVTVIDLRDRSKFTRKSPLSDQLIEAMQTALDHGEQSLLFLNRRGTARIIFCEKCSWQALCPHCDLPLVYHGDTHRIRCHICNYVGVSPSSCSNCNNTSILFKSLGTKAIVDEASRLFPQARIMRFDADNKKSERIEQYYSKVKNGETDIIVGTQTLAKGIDLPRLSLVGIVMADTSLYFPDFSAQERTYQLLSQALGRVGRGHRSSQAIVQTYAPYSTLLKAILSKDWPAFYRQEIQERRRFLFPPFCHLLKLTCRSINREKVEHKAKVLAQQLNKEADSRIIVEGPVPAFREKSLGKYQWQLVIKAKERSELLRIIASLPNGWAYDIDPIDLL